jgi:hypothetical protein
MEGGGSSGQAVVCFRGSDAHWLVWLGSIGTMQWVGPWSGVTPSVTCQQLYSGCTGFVHRWLRNFNYNWN